MAVGGRKDTSYISSLEHGNDFLFDFTCSPCNADGKNKEAIKFCIECGEYLCGNCLNDHNRFAKMKKHQIVDPSKRQTIDTNPTTFMAPSITICCEKHSGKALDMFCGDHDEVCCAVCIALDHSLCKSRHYIPDISKDYKKSEEFKQQEADGQIILSNLVSVINKKQADVELYKRQKEAIIDHFREVKEDILKQFNEMEKQSVGFVEERFQQNVTKAMEDIKKAEVVYKTLEINKDKIKTEMDDSQAFVLAKRTGKSIASAKETVKGILTKKPMSFDYRIHEEVRNYLKRFKSLGYFDNAKRQAKCDVFSVQDKVEKYRCDITGLCQLQDGDFIAVDAANKSVKRFDSTYIVSDKCWLLSQPWSVCNVGNTEIAVSLCIEKKIQFISVKGKMNLSRSIGVKDTCTGLASCRGELYVGLLNRKQIQVYDYSGYPQRFIDLADRVPWHIALSMDSSYLYVASRDDGVFSINLKTLTSVKIDVPGVKSASSIALISNGSLLVSCLKSSKIFQYTSNGSQTLLTKSDGIASPQTVFYDRNQRLLVASEKADVIKIYSDVDE